MSKTPKLRFKEFSGDWESKKLGDISKIYDGTHQTPKYTDSGVKFVSVENINNIYEGNKYISEEDYNKNFKIKPQLNDIFMTRITAGEIGATAIIDREENLAYYVSVALIRAYNEKVNSLFLTKYIASKYFKKELNKRIIHVAFPKKINLGDIGDCGLNLPKLEEQEKIASFFSLIDEKISLQGEKLEMLKDYKRGMMQKIFSRELRFKDDEGRDYPEWEEKKLGDISDIGTGSNDLQDKVDDGIYPFFVRSANIERINSYTFDGEAILIPGDGNIGQIYHYINGKFAYHQRVYKISDFVEGISGKYIYYYMSRFFLKEALKNSVKATVDSLRLPTLTGMKVLLPCIEEQVKISEVLNKLEEKINKEQEKLDTLNEYKKGLLQQMFV